MSRIRLKSQPVLAFLLGVGFANLAPAQMPTIGRIGSVTARGFWAVPL